MRRLAFALAALLAGCASTESAESTVHADVHCVEQKMVPITVGGYVHMVPGGCRAWAVGPTPRETQAFDALHGRQHPGVW